MKDFLKTLNGTIYVIPGKWDRASKDISDTKVGSGLNYHLCGIKEISSLKAVLSYWPLVDWPKKNKGHISFVGHENKKYESDHTKGIVNVRCDDWEYKPIIIENIVTLFNDPDLLD